MTAWDWLNKHDVCAFVLACCVGMFLVSAGCALENASQWWRRKK